VIITDANVVCTEVALLLAPTGESLRQCRVINYYVIEYLQSSRGAMLYRKHDHQAWKEGGASKVTLTTYLIESMTVVLLLICVNRPSGATLSI
jgi:hypothetical protein